MHPHLLAQLGGELESLFIRHVVQEKGVNLHPLRRTLAAFETKQRLLSFRLAKPIVNCQPQILYFILGSLGNLTHIFQQAI